MKLFCSSTLVFFTILLVRCASTVHGGKLMLKPMDPVLCSSDNVTFMCTGNNLLIKEKASLYKNDQLLSSIFGYQDKFTLSHTLKNVSLSDNLSVVVCMVGNEKEQIFSMLMVNKYKGSLLPLDPIACVPQEINFTCTLLDNPVVNKTILFYVKTPSDNAYLAAEETDVTVVNTSVSQYTVNVTESGDTLVRCYYSEPNQGTKPSIKYRIGSTSTIHASKVFKPTVTDFNCVAENFVDHLNCSWKYEGDYEVKPNVSFDWKISVFSSWNPCPDLNSENDYCYWESTGVGDFSTKNIDVEINITYERCGESFPVIDLYSYHVDTKKKNKPNPVDDLTSLVINSTCIKLDWSTRNSRPEYEKIQNVEASSEWNSTDVEIYTEENKSTHNYIFCGLQEYTTYTFTIKIKPKGPTYDGYWSDARSIRNRTASAVPSASPAVALGGYSWNPQVCKSQQTRRVHFMLQPIDLEDENGQMKGLEVSFNNDTPRMIAEDSLYFYELLLCQESYHVTLRPYNDAGKANKTSVISVEKWTDGIVQPTLKVESMDTTNKTGNHTVHLQWSNPPVANAIGYNVFHCTKLLGGCKPNDGGVMEWKFYSKETHEAYMNVESSELSFGVSLITETGSSGLQWETCVYTKGVCPTKAVQNVVVSTGSEDDTLVVTWDKLSCQSGEPYISSYIITYCKVNSESCNDKEVPADLGRAVLYDLEEKYSVKVMGSNEDNCDGPYSDIVYGTPEHKALKSGEIVGIVMACLIVVFMAGVGLFCCLRRSKAKFKLWKKKTGGVRLPVIDGNVNPYPTTFPKLDSSNDEINSSQKSLDRQDSKDSGVPLTPEINEKPEFIIHPDGYCVCYTTNKSDSVDNDRMNLSNAERHNTSTAHNELMVGCVHDCPTPSCVIKNHNSSMPYVQSSETPNKDTAIPQDYNKATITGNVNKDDSGCSKDEQNQSKSTGHSSTTVDSNCPAEKKEKLIKLTSIPKPEGYDSSPDFPEYLRLSATIDDNCLPKESQDSDQTTDSYVKAPVVNDSQHQNQMADSIVESDEQSEGALPRSKQIHSYVKSPIQYEGDSSYSDNINSYIISPVPNGGIDPQADQISSPYVTSLVHNAGEISHSDQMSNSAESQVLSSANISNWSQIDSYVKSPVEYGVDAPNSPKISNYVMLPENYDGDITCPDHTSDTYIKSPIQYGGETTHPDHTSDSYIKSPIQYGGETTHPDHTSDSYIKSPIQYGGETTHPDHTSDTYIKSPIQYDGETTRPDHTSDTYIKSPIQYGGETTHPDHTSDSYIKSPIQYGGDTTPSDLVSDSYIKSPIQYGGDITRPDHTSDSYIKSPIQYGGDTTPSDLVSDSYIKSPIQYGGDITPSDLVSDSYIKSPIQYDGDITHPDHTSDTYIKSPLQYGGDIAPSDLVSDSYIKSPVQYGGDCPNLEQVPNQCNGTISTPLSVTKPPTSKTETSNHEPSNSIKLDDTFSHNNNNDITQNNCTPLATTTPYVDINKMEILNNVPIHTSTYDNTAFVESEDSDGSDALTASAMYEQSHDQNKNVHQDYVTVDTVLHLNNQQNCSVEKNKESTNQSTSDYIDISKMESLGRQALDFQPDHRSQCRTTSGASDSSDDSLVAMKFELEGKTKTGSNSDSGLSSLENGGASD